MRSLLVFVVHLVSILRITDGAPVLNNVVGGVVEDVGHVVCLLRNLQDPKRCRNSGVASPDTPSDLPAGATSTITSSSRAPIGLESASIPMQSTNSGLTELTTGTTSSGAPDDGSGIPDGITSTLSQVPIPDLSNVADSVTGQATGSGLSSGLSRIARMDGVLGVSGRAAPTDPGGLSGVPDHTTRIDSSNSPTSGTSSRDILNLAGDATSGGTNSGLGRSSISRRDCPTDRDGDRAAYANSRYPETNANSPTAVDTPHDSSSGTDNGSTSSDTPNTSDGSRLDSSRVGSASSPTQTSDLSGARYGPQSTGYGGALGHGSNAESGHSAASNTAGSSLDRGPHYPEAFPSATNTDSPDHNSDRGAGGNGGGRTVSGDSDTVDHSRFGATDGDGDPAAYADTQYPGSPTAPHDSSSGSDNGTTSSGTPNTSDDSQRQSTGHGGGIRGSDAGDDSRLGATDGKGDPGANSPTAVDTPHDSDSSSGSDIGSTSSGTPRSRPQSTGHGGSMGGSNTGDDGRFGVTDGEGDPAADSPTPHDSDSSSGSDIGSTSSGTPNTSDDSQLDSSRPGYASFPTQTSSDLPGARYGSQSTGLGGDTGYGSKANTGYPAAFNTAGSDREGGPRYPEVFPPATNSDSPDHNSDRGSGGVSGGRGVSGGSDTGNDSRFGTTYGNGDPAANSPTAVDTPHDSDSSSGSDDRSSSRGTPNPRPQSTGHGGGMGGSDTGDDSRIGATDGDGDSAADSPTAVDTPHDSDSSSASNNGSTSRGTNPRPQSTGYGGGIRGSDTGDDSSSDGEGDPAANSPTAVDTPHDPDSSDVGSTSSGTPNPRPTIPRPQSTGHGGGIRGSDSSFGATDGDGDPRANSPTAVDTPHDSDSDSGSDNGSTSRGTPNPRPTNPRPQSTGHGGSMGGSNTGDDSRFGATYGEGDPTAYANTQYPDMNANLPTTPHGSSSDSDNGSTSRGTPNSRPPSTGHGGGIRGSGTGDDSSSDGEGDPAAYANTQYPDTNANSPTTPHGSSSDSDDGSTSSGTPNTSNDSRPPSTGHEGGMGYGSKADTGYPAAFNTAGSGQDGGPRYPNAFPSATNSDSPGHGSDRGSRGGGAGKGISGGSDTGDDSGFGANQRNASAGSATCTDEVTCTDIHVDNENVGKAETAPTIGYTQSNLVKGVTLPEVREKENGCPGGDINACLDGNVSGGR
ncbi:hypothetical protein C8Q74DRAFT_741786 [Fomes fomentarius]|nr:hypothetical protein C8Q74DRAFT_741786 [Fomes fomentarius]